MINIILISKPNQKEHILRTERKINFSELLTEHMKSDQKYPVGWHLL